MQKVDKKVLCDVVNAFMNLKKVHQHNVTNASVLVHSKRTALLILYKNADNDVVSLSFLREELNLAPSTITSILTSLEEEELIERIIDKSDRRNIFIRILPKGIEYAQKAYTELEGKIADYIDYIGEEDAKILVRLISKTAEYFKERKNDK